MNGGTCVDDSDRYACHCVDGIVGNNCEIGNIYEYIIQ